MVTSEQTATTDAGTPGPGYGVDVLLADGSIARIRPLTAGDERALRAIHHDASDESIVNRFFALNRHAADAYVDHLLEASTREVMTLVVEQTGHVRAVATAERLSPDAAEVSFFVADDAHGNGLATLLLEHLAAVARREGVRHFSAAVRHDNRAMLQVLRDAGFDVEAHVARDEVQMEMSTEATEGAIEAADLRECAAEARSLERLWRPRVVAVVGVRRAGGGIGKAVLDSIREYGYGGRLVVIHPSAVEVDGVPAYHGFGDVPDRVDLVIVAVPRDAVEGVVAAAGAHGARAAVILTSGFAEADSEGLESQRRIVRLARRHGMRLVGPNCFGLGSFAPDVLLNATFARDAPLPGSLAVASQSGGVGIALLDAANRVGLGLAFFVSLGNKADVSGNDLLAAWMDDDHVAAAAIYLESFGNPRKFARFARRFSERKPLVAVVGGRSAEGSRAGASHTAAATTPATAVDAVFTQAGVIAVSGVDELVEAALLLTRAPLPQGFRIGIVGNAGGVGVLAADAAHREGLTAPLLSEALRSRLATEVGAAPGLTNPVDLGAAAGPASFRAAIQALLDSGEIDSVLVVFAATRVGDTDGVVAAIREAASSASVPVVLVLHGDDAPPAGPALPDLPILDSVEGAAHALALATRYAAWRAAPRTVAGVRVGPAAVEARTRAAGMLDGAPPGRAWLTSSQVRELVTPYGIDAPVGTVVSSVDEAIAAAARIGFPVAAKVADPEVLHKTDRKLVLTGLISSDEIRRAAQSFCRELGRNEVPLLVQPMVHDGVELALGVTRDPTFGPVIMVAAGGVATEVWKDRVFLVPPVTAQDAARAIGALRIAPLLSGFRGAPAVDVGAARDLVVAVARLAEDVPSLAEMDLNPVIVTPDGAFCVDARIRLAESPDTEVAGVPRQLRAPC